MIFMISTSRNIDFLRYTVLGIVYAQINAILFPSFNALPYFSCKFLVLSKYTAGIASFGSKISCGLLPGGFARITEDVFTWINSTVDTRKGTCLNKCLMKLNVWFSERRMGKMDLVVNM